MLCLQACRRVAYAGKRRHSTWVSATASSTKWLATVVCPNRFELMVEMCGTGKLWIEHLICSVLTGHVSRSIRGMLSYVDNVMIVLSVSLSCHMKTPHREYQ